MTLDVERAVWPVPAHVVALTTTRRGAGVSRPPYDALNVGDHVGDDPTAVAANRLALRRALGLPAEPHWLRQVHGVDVVRVAGAPGADAPVADGAVTFERDTVLAIQTADCLPVLLTDRDGSVAGAAHAGWRGLCNGVLERVVEAMKRPPEALCAWLGPAIGPTAYEVGDEVREAFLARDGRAAVAFAATRPGHWHCDLYALARQRLRVAGVDAVYGGDRCTFGERARFYSYRRDRETGRMASLLWRSR